MSSNLPTRQGGTRPSIRRASAHLGKWRCHRSRFKTFDVRWGLLAGTLRCGAQRRNKWNWTPHREPLPASANIKNAPRSMFACDFDFFQLPVYPDWDLTTR